MGHQYCLGLLLNGMFRIDSDFLQAVYPCILPSTYVIRSWAAGIRTVDGIQEHNFFLLS